MIGGGGGGGGGGALAPPLVPTPLKHNCVAKTATHTLLFILVMPAMSELNLFFFVPFIGK